jgi:hypothetical protein
MMSINGNNLNTLCNNVYENYLENYVTNSDFPRSVWKIPVTLTKYR